MEHRLYDKLVSKSKVTNLSFPFYNIEGYRRIHLIQPLDLEIICQNHFVCLYETWCEKELQLTAFNSFNKIESKACRKYLVGRSSGGIVIYYKQESVTLVKILKIHNNYISVRFKFKDTYIILVAAYISKAACDTIITSDLSLHLNELEMKFTNDILVLGGDFNGRVAELDNGAVKYVSNWGRNESTRSSLDLSSDDRGKKLLEIAEDNNLILLNGRTNDDIPAQFTFAGHNGQSTIDLAFIRSNYVHKCLSLKTLPLEYSTHFPIQLKINIHDKIKCTETTKLVWKNDKLDEYQTKICELLKLQSTYSYDGFCEIIYTAASACGMLKKVKHKTYNSKPWFDYECLEKRVLVKNTLKQARYRHTNIAWKDYNVAKKNYLDILRKKKYAYEMSIRDNLNKCRNSGNFWSAVKRYRNKSQHANIVSEEAWIDFHKTILPALNSTSKLYEGNKCTELEQPITKHELIKAIRKSPLSKSVGPDGIQNEFIKYLPAVGIDNLLGIFNNIFGIEKPPADWIQSITAMIYKKGDSKDPMNYRPISLLNHLLKIFTQIIQTRLSAWADENGSLPACQAGFREGRSTEDQVFCLNTAI